MVISNTATNSLAGTTYAQPTAAATGSSATTTTSSSGSSDSVHLSATAEATGYKQQGLSISQIASLMGVTTAQVDSYLYITPVPASGAVSGGGGGGAVASTAKSGGGSTAAASSSTSTTATIKSAAPTTATSTATATPAATTKLKAA